MSTPSIAVLAPVIVTVKHDCVLSASGRARYSAYVSHAILHGENETACGRFTDREVQLAPVGHLEVECRACNKVGVDL